MCTTMKARQPEKVHTSDESPSETIDGDSDNESGDDDNESVLNGVDKLTVDVLKGHMAGVVYQPTDYELHDIAPLVCIPDLPAGDREVFATWYEEQKRKQKDE